MLYKSVDKFSFYYLCKNNSYFVSSFKLQRNYIGYQPFNNPMINKKHFKNLITMALADGYLDQTEYELLIIIAQKNNIPESEIRKLRSHTKKTCREENHSFDICHLEDLVAMMCIDGIIHDSEWDLCINFAKKIGLTRHKAEKLISELIQKEHKLLS